MNNSLKVFNGNMCFICNLTVNERELKKCSSCKLVYYCSEAHKKIHWKQHKRLCHIIKKVDSILESENGSIDGWFNYRTSFLKLCELGMGRKLLPDEFNMILFPNNCQICHSQLNLQPCFNCLCVNYCSEEHKQFDSASHKEVCHLFALCVEIDLLLEKTSFNPDYFLREGIISLMDSTHDFIDNNIVINSRNSLDTKQEKVLLSEFITCPLTVLYALKVTNFELKKNVLLHVVGCSYLETASLESWEIILHLNPHIKSLLIVFIGPEVTEVIDTRICQSCQKKLKFKFLKILYHNLNDSLLKEADVICTFNCGYHAFENSECDTWKKSLPFLINKKKTLLVFTSFTQIEAEKDASRLLQINPTLDISIKKNKFSSLRPYRDLENLGVFFNNEYIGIVLSNS